MKSVFKLILSGLVLMISLANAQQIKQLTDDLLNAKNDSQKREATTKILNAKPQTLADVDALMTLVKSTKDEGVKNAAMISLQNVNENDGQLTGVYLKAMEDKSGYIRFTAITALGKLQAKEAAPKLRKIVKDFSHVKFLAYKATAMVSPLKGMEMLSDVAAAIGALGEMRDEESIPLLVDKFDDLGEFACTALAKIGKKALPAILELARKEANDVHHYYGKWALAGIQDKEAKAELMDIVVNDKNEEIKTWAMKALTTNLYDDEVLNMAEEQYSKDYNPIFLTAMKTKKAVPYLIRILKNEYKPDDQWYAACLLGDIKDSSAIPALEEALKSHDRNIGIDAAQALQKITGKKYEWENK